MQGWLFWAMPGRGDRRPRADFKIYVSPTLEALPDLLPVILEVFAECGVRLFKIGADLPGLARPDKIVAYMDEFQQVEELGRQLASCLRDVPVHGVPFTAELSGDGLVSWGMDPHEGAVVDGQERPSWRLWITNRIAAALLDARQAGTRNVEPWRFALDRLRLDGVDVDAWTPTAAYHANLSR